MNRLPIIAIVPICIIAFGCGSDDAAEGSENSQLRAPDDGNESANPVEFASQENGETSPCSPIVDEDGWGDCSPGIGNTFCMPLNGELFHWDSSKSCVKTLWSWSDIVNDRSRVHYCVDTGVVLDHLLILTYSPSGFERDLDGDMIEIVVLNDTHENWIENAILEAGWRRMSREFWPILFDRPECP